MNVLKITLCAVAATAAMAGASAAFAADDTIALSYNVGVATDYVFRGIDQTPNTGEAFGGVDAVIAKQFYAGLWISNTGPSGGKGIETDLYAGWKPSLGPVTFDLGAIYYLYNNNSALPNNSHASDYELKAGASIPLGGFTFGAVDFYGPSNNAFPLSATKDGNTNYLEGDVSYTFKNKATVSAAYGNFQVESAGALSGGHYNTWNAGVTYPVTDKLSIDARYIGGTPTGFAFNGAVGTLKVAF
jgi:uncharacterized protein (TIGR02001 family)